MHRQNIKGFDLARPQKDHKFVSVEKTFQILVTWRARTVEVRDVVVACAVVPAWIRDALVQF